jgi:hypothetical protein
VRAGGPGKRAGGDTGTAPWADLTIHLAPELAEFARENKDWLRVYRLPVQAAVQADDPAAARAGRPGDRLGSGGAQLLDQPQHRRGGRLRAIAGEQARIGLHDPGQPAQFALAGEHSPGGIGDRRGGQQRIHPVMILVRTASGSRSSRSGHRSQRGWPARSRLATGRRWPHDAHVRSASRRTHTQQYQSWPWRCNEVTSRSQAARRADGDLVRAIARLTSVCCGMPCRGWHLAAPEAGRPRPVPSEVPSDARPA